jgi:hypothetical protein
MRRASSRRIVIDASVAFSAGDLKHPSADPSSGCCRKFLASVLSICHRVVITDAIQQEWSKHENSYARKWRKSMVARKKAVILASPPTNHALREAAATSSPHKRDRDAMLKDCHLIEAAMATDCIVASRDDEAQRLFALHASSLPGIGDIVWVNPVEPADEVASWLESGAPPDNQYQLKHYQPRE